MIVCELRNVPAVGKHQENMGVTILCLFGLEKACDKFRVNDIVLRRDRRDKHGDDLAPLNLPDATHYKL